ncbi:phosphoribosyltransferase domain-containing protein [Pseudomonas veronii]|uniref:Phosphoribosyltransferase n=1 Tax=Pseudomonas cremoris TaxID=2724178 RepID=A0ABR6TD07_9PSED|nr:MULTISPECIES: phosphoribosyltransferase domain-containing protein [Pseudomonas]KRP87983.1 phosphoribosyltransferase [Pseudomonas lactis]MBC2383834.1 phosphoribosyltransferase [Pseudomonas cremoris]MBJ2180086.1 phosphoribosyltransferase domain-containing protein [Pseudomonas veronii]MDI3187545.1 phosphoribosyltransferase domain-containing protein [Pseudomonas paracarnis]WLI50409.1 phosphoribosyltransferase domain-containing protein [Pseudomonas sp. FP833]
MESNAVTKALSVQLMRGRLDVTVDASQIDPGSLFGFAERRNPKRAFLFVSKVLGRHIPVRPSIMNASFHSLAAQIPEDLPGPVLVIGMAETAVGLGAGVHRAFSATRPDTVYMVSTRHPTGNELFARFEEEHSHASAHLIHLPVDPDVREMMLNARSLVLVDDEASTGKTFINLHRALVDAGLTQVERVVTCVLTDWSGDAVRKTIGDSAHQVSLLQGSYTFHEDAEAPLPEMPAVGTIEPGEWPLTAESDWGRHGIRVVEDTLALDLNVKAGERVLVVGTSEFVWRPFLLAERLERAGADVHFSSTSRSPIALGHAIGHVLSFADNYGLGIPNFLYNVSPGQFDRVLICSETPVQAVSASLIESLNAEVIVDGQ